MTHSGRLATEWDVVVIGAGPAGSIAAASCAGRGLSVLLVDKQRFPRAKVCGCCVNRNALAALERLGAATALRSIDAVPLSAWRAARRGRSVCFSNRDFGGCIARSELDAALSAFAQARGAVFWDEAVATMEKAESGFRPVQLRRGQEVRSVRARVVVAAYGLGPRLSAEIGPQVKTARFSRIGASTSVDRALPFYRPGTIYMACGRLGYVGLVRLADGRLNLASAVDGLGIGRQGIGCVAAEILREAGWPDPDCESAAWRGTAQLTSSVTVPAAERLFMVGDAAGYVEPFTGDGIWRAIESGAAIAEFVHSACQRWENSLISAWADRWRSVTKASTRSARLAAAVLRSPTASGLVFGAMTAFPTAARSVIDLFTAPKMAAGVTGE